jgi:hypothetical protein
MGGDMSDDVYTSDGVVRGLTFGNSRAGSDFVHIRLARDVTYYVDFDSPEVWEGTKGTAVRIWWTESVNEISGLVYRKVLDMVDLDSEES